MRALIQAAAVVAALVTTPFIAQASSCPPYPDGLKAVVYLEFNKEVLVRDTYIGQKGCDLKLAIVVNAAANEAYARSVGERFVRLTKALGPGPGPSKQVGKGIYNFLVGVFTPGQKQLALGAKSSGARRITW